MQLLLAVENKDEQAISKLVDPALVAPLLSKSVDTKFIDRSSAKTS
jgi:hypothetical protein